MKYDLLKVIAQETLTTPALNLPPMPSDRIGFGIASVFRDTVIQREALSVLARENTEGKDIDEIIKIAEPVKKGIARTRTKTLCIGSDPEFLLVSGNKYVVASHFVRDPNHNAKCGLDGYPHVGELRPTHGNPDEHFEEVKKCISYLKNVPIRAIGGSGAYYNRPIGGHLHFNIPPLISAVIALEEYIGKPFLKYSSRSIVGRFGKPIDIERKPWGFEYRSLPSWISHPDLAYMVIVTAYCIVDSARKNSFFIPNKESFFSEVIPGHMKYESVLHEYWDQVISSPWTKFENKDIIKAWSL